SRSVMFPPSLPASNARFQSARMPAYFGLVKFAPDGGIPVLAPVICDAGMPAPLTAQSAIANALIAPGQPYFCPYEIAAVDGLDILFQPERSSMLKSILP